MVCGGERHRMLRVPLGIVPQLITTGLRATLALSKLLVALTHSEPKSRAALGSSGREAAVKPSEQPSPAQVDDTFRGAPPQPLISHPGGHTDCVNILIAFRADVNAQNGEPLPVRAGASAGLP